MQAKLLTSQGFLKVRSDQEFIHEFTRMGANSKSVREDTCTAPHLRSVQVEK
jgi:hypothetical protein